MYETCPIMDYKTHAKAGKLLSCPKTGYPQEYSMDGRLQQILTKTTPICPHRYEANTNSEKSILITQTNYH